MRAWSCDLGWLSLVCTGMSKCLFEPPRKLEARKLEAMPHTPKSKASIPCLPTHGTPVPDARYTRDEMQDESRRQGAPRFRRFGEEASVMRYLTAVAGRRRRQRKAVGKIVQKASRLMGGGKEKLENPNMWLCSRCLCFGRYERHDMSST